uniref:Cystatin domain-containing protein n=1 Tax=Leersia perrieri TaxID=77586 RepID=A0A0D9WP00_9ORYZ
MASRLLTAVAIIAVYVAATAPIATAIIRGRHPIKDINDPHTQELGQWAVSETNKVKPSSPLTFSKVTSGKEHYAFSTMEYILHIDASRNDVIHSYTAVVIEEAAKLRKLFSFRMNHS